MSGSIVKNSKFNLIKLIIKTIIFVFIFQCSSVSAKGINSNEDIRGIVQNIFVNRNKAIIDGDLELIKSIYDTKTKYGMWAYEYEAKKLKYIRNWEEKQGVRFTEINPTIVIKGVKNVDDKYSIDLECSTEYKYIYENQQEKINTSGIRTYHTLQLIERDSNWVIVKEWYKDPLADSLYLDNLKANSIRQYILSKNERDFSRVNKRRLKAVEYADKYCGIAKEEKHDYKYNKKYRNYNQEGGDCANFASQILFEGGKFRKNSSWNYDSKDATRAWLNADGFKNYMVNSGRASVITYGNYDKVYKASYNLLPGDFVAYEKKGDIIHISVVTGADSKGYSLVSCHNTDRDRVPWDLGWNDKDIRFWLVRVHY